MGIGSCGRSFAEFEMAMISTGASGAELGPAITLVSAPCTTALMDRGALISGDCGMVVRTSQWSFAPCDADHTFNFVFTVDRYHLDFEWSFRV